MKGTEMAQAKKQQKPIETETETTAAPEAPAETKAKTPSKPRAARKVISPRFKLAEFKRQVFSVDVERGTDITDLLSPEYWAGVTDQVRTKSRIECHWEDNSEFAELVVLSAGKNFCEVGLLFHKRFNEKTGGGDTEADNNHSVAHQGNFDKWCVTRLSDKLRLQKGFDTELQARKWLIEYLGG